MNRLHLSLLLALLASSVAAAEVSTAALEAALEQIGSLEPGRESPSLATLSAAVQAAETPSQKAALEDRLIRFLKGASSRSGRLHVTQQLGRIASASAVPVLSTLLADPELSDAARHALENIHDESSARALREALGRTDGSQKTGIISSLGQKRDSGSVGVIAPLLFDADPDIAATSASVLGQIGTPEAVQALSSAGAKTEGTLQETIFDALLQTADRMTGEGAAPAAGTIYRGIFTANAPGFIRSAALRGLVLSDPGGSATLLRKAVRSPDPEIQAVAIGLAARSKAPGMIAELARELPRLPAQAQAQLLTALGQSGDPAALPALIKAARGADPQLRLTALEQLGLLGDESTVELLLQVAAHGRDGENTTARSSLHRLRGDQVDATILGHLVTGDAGVRVEVIKAAGQRKIPDAIGPLLLAARDPDAKVRSEALKVLADAGTPEQFPALLQLLVDPTEGTDRVGAEKALISLLRRHSNAGLDTLLQAAGRIGDSQTRASLLSVAGTSHDPRALALLMATLDDRNLEIRKTAIRSLGDWSNPAPLPALLKVAGSDEDKVSRILALRGYINLVGIESERSSAETAGLLSEAMKVAERTDEKRSILALLPRFPCPEAMKLAGAAAADPELATEARSALQSLREAGRK